MNYLNIDKIQKCLDTEFIGRNMVYFKRLDSTSTFATGLLKEGLSSFKTGSGAHSASLPKNSGTVIIAETQYRGVGRQKKYWCSPPEGLWFTIILNPDFKKVQAPLCRFPEFTIISASAVLAALGDIIADNIISPPENTQETCLKIKWPNDIYYSGRKLAGILSESENLNSHIYLLIGIGINVNFTTEKKIFRGLNAISLLDILGKHVDRDELLAGILNLFEKRYTFFAETGDFYSIFKTVEKYMIF